MRHFLISAAAMTAFAALLASAPANAIESYGPNKVGNQCLTAAAHHGRDLGFGIWGTCPQTASVAATRAASRRAKR